MLPAAQKMHAGLDVSIQLRYEADTNLHLYAAAALDDEDVPKVATEFITQVTC